MPVDAGAGASATAFAVGSNVTRVVITGLAAGARYAVAMSPSGTSQTVTVTASASGGLVADSGGVIVIGGTTVTSSLSLTTALNAHSFRAGDRMVVTATLTPGSAPPPVDAYIVVRLPDGRYLSWTGAGLVPGLVPIVRNFTPVAYQGDIVQVTVPPGTPPGSYAWLSAVTSPGTLTLLSPIAESPFTIVP
jgi:hypothetical protein